MARAALIGWAAVLAACAAAGPSTSTSTSTNAASTSTDARAAGTSATTATLGAWTASPMVGTSASATVERPPPRVSAGAARAIADKAWSTLRQQVELDYRAPALEGPSPEIVCVKDSCEWRFPIIVPNGPSSFEAGRVLVDAERGEARYDPGDGSEPWLPEEFIAYRPKERAVMRVVMRLPDVVTHCAKLKKEHGGGCSFGVAERSAGSCPKAVHLFDECLWQISVHDPLGSRMATFSIEPQTLAIVAVSPMWCGLMTLRQWRAGEAASRAGRAPPCDEE